MPAPTAASFPQPFTGNPDRGYAEFSATRLKGMQGRFTLVGRPGHAPTHRSAPDLQPQPRPSAGPAKRQQAKAAPPRAACPCSSDHPRPQDPLHPAGAYRDPSTPQSCKRPTTTTSIRPWTISPSDPHAIRDARATRTETPSRTKTIQEGTPISRIFAMQLPPQSGPNLPRSDRSAPASPHNP